MGRPTNDAADERVDVKHHRLGSTGRFITPRSARVRASFAPTLLSKNPLKRHV
eukprot:JP439427.1.p2 GENE.JP439427.1~~JP439427.1.p2  ORF type:complete len:53 (-),score=1.71 JP439427.1:241-399(-)